MKVFKILSDGSKKVLAKVSEDDLDSALVDKVNSGGDIFQNIVLSANTTFNKSDLTGNILLISTNDTTARRITIGTGFTANDSLTLIFNVNSSGLINLTINSKTFNSNRGNILEFIYNGTNWICISMNGWDLSTENKKVFSLGFAINNILDGYNFINIGYNNRNDGESVTIGLDNTDTSQNSGIIYGRNNTNSGTFATLFGRQNNNSGSYSNLTGWKINNDVNYVNLFGNNTKGRYVGEFSWRTDNGSNDNATSTESISHNRIVNWGVRTTNVTQTDAYLNNGSNKLVIANKTQCLIIGNIQAYRSDQQESKSWEFKALIHRPSGGADFIGTPTKTVLFQSSGASTWDIALIVNGSDNSFDLKVTGENSTTIFWKAIATINEMTIY